MRAKVFLIELVRTCAITFLFVTSFALANSFEFDDGTVQGWTLQGAYVDGAGPYSSNFFFDWKDQVNYPGIPGADASGNNLGSLMMFTIGGHGIVATGDWWIMQFHSPDLSSDPDWQNATGYTVEIAECMAAFPENMYSNLYVRVYDHDLAKDRYFYNGSAQLLDHCVYGSEAIWNHLTFDWSGLLPANYTVKEVFVNIWGEMTGAYFEGGTYLDHVVPTVAEEPPVAPSNLDAHLLTDQIHVTWQDNSDNETGFRLQRSLGLGYSDLAILPPNTTSFQMDDPVYNMTYYFRVCAFNDAGDSAYSNIDSVKVLHLLSYVNIYSPNGGEGWPEGSKREISYRAYGGLITPIKYVTIELSLDGGSNWPKTPIASNVPNTGSFFWTIPGTYSDNCIIKVKDAAEGYPYDLSNHPFSITPPAPDLVVDSVWLDPPEPKLGQSFDIEVTISNTGSLDAGDFWVDWYSHSDYPPMVGQYGDRYSYISSLTAGADYTMDETYAYSEPGMYQTYSLADSTGNVSEADENNNVFTAQQVDLSGRCVAFGSNTYGQLELPKSDNYIAVDAGWDHCLALKSDGSLVAWGSDSYGQVSNTPTESDFVAIGAGYYHNVALKSNGSVVAWGRDNYGQVSSAPTDPDFIAVAAGGYHCLALKSNNSIFSWGSNAMGQVSSTPTETVYIAIASGGEHSLAIKNDLSAIGWGWDGYGQASPPAGSFQKVVAGQAHSFGLKSDGSIIGWGYDNLNQLSEIPAGTDFVDVASGTFHGLGIKVDGSIVAWGNNGLGQASPPEGQDFIDIAGGSQHSLTLSRCPLYADLTGDCAVDLDDLHVFCSRWLESDASDVCMIQPDISGDDCTVNMYDFDKLASFWRLGVKRGSVLMYAGTGYDFSDGTAGGLSWGDFYLSSSGTEDFYANNSGQNGLQDVGIQQTLVDAAIPDSGYYRFGVPVVAGHTYVSLSEDGEEGCYVIFKVNAFDEEKVSISYIYRYPYVGYAALVAEDIEGMTEEMGDSNIDGSDGNEFWPGTYFIYRTDEFKFGKFIVEDLDPDDNNKLTIGWKTYNPNGSVYSTGSGLEIRGTWDCDLDEGVEGPASGEDFFWYQLTSEVRYLDPRNGALFKLMYRAD
jgi:hypothetical protein